MAVNPSADRARVRRGRPPTIDRQRIVDTVLDIGLAGFVMDDVAARLNVTVPALYHHVRSRDELVSLAAVELIERAQLDLDEIDEWDQWLRAWATQLRDRLGSAGLQYVASLTDAQELQGVPVAERGLTLLVAAGFKPAEAGYALWLALRISCTSLPFSSGGLEHVVSATGPSLSAPSSSDVARAVTAELEFDATASFRFDLDVLIAGLSARRS